MPTTGTITEDVSQQEGQGSLDVPKDAGQGSEGVVQRWLLEIKLAEQTFKNWRKQGKEAVERYESDEKGKRNRYNILWANTETLMPALYDSTPKPDIRRRYRDEDPIGKEVAEVLERAATFSIDAYDFDNVMDGTILDYLLAGRGLARVRYEPKFTKEQDAEGNSFDSLAFEEVTSEMVHWDKFIHGPGKKWEDITWIAFEHSLTRDDLVENFEGIGRTIELDQDLRADASETPRNESDANVFKRLKVWEIWDKDSKRIFFIAPSHKKAPLKVDEDPLGLKGFFPIPRPLYSIKKAGSLVPTPEYHLYRKQADELDKVTGRIDKLIDGLKVRGIYDGTISEFQRLVSAGDNDLVPGSNVTSLIERGGLDKAIWMMPIDVAANVLKELYLQREQIKQVIFEITGISDIIRGASDPRETATAQNLKGRFGALRLERRQRDVQRFARDLIRLKTEIMAERFQPETLSIMTNKQVGQEVIQIIRQDSARDFKIDIETDSTIARQLTEDQEAVTQLLGGIASFVTAIGPAVVGGFFPQEVAIEMIKAAARKAKLGRELDNVIEETTQNQQQQGPQQPEGPGPEEIAAQQEQQAKQAEMQLKAQEMQENMQLKQAELQLKAQEGQTKAQIEQEKLAHDGRKFEMQLAADNQLKAAELQQREGLEIAKLQDNQVARQETRDETQTLRRQDGIPDQSFEEDMNQLAQAIQLMAQAIIQQGQAQAETNAQLIQAITAPKKLVRDAQGRPAGVEVVNGV